MKCTSEYATKETCIICCIRLDPGTLSFIYPKIKGSLYLCMMSEIWRPHRQPIGDSSPLRYRCLMACFHTHRAAFMIVTRTFETPLHSNRSCVVAIRIMNTRFFGISCHDSGDHNCYSTSFSLLFKFHEMFLLQTVF